MPVTHVKCPHKQYICINIIHLSVVGILYFYPFKVRLLDPKYLGAVNRPILLIRSNYKGAAHDVDGTDLIVGEKFDLTLIKGRDVNFGKDLKSTADRASMTIQRYSLPHLIATAFHLFLLRRRRNTTSANFPFVYKPTEMPALGVQVCVDLSTLFAASA